MKKQKNRNQTFLEQYEVQYDYQKEDGYWVFSATADVFVEVEHGVNEKNNHDKAKKQFQKDHPEARITCVTY